jgi:hypothetical protein
MKVSEDGNIIITGLILTNNILVTLKYNTEGELLWVNTHPGASPGYRHSVKFDSWRNVYVAGVKASDFTTIKYDNNGNEKWIHSYNGPASGGDAATSLSIDKNGNLYVTGFSTGVGTGYDITTIKYPGSFVLSNPKPNDKWIAGEVDTIKWIGGQSGQFFQVELSIDNGNTHEIIDFGIPADSGYYIWQLADNILTTKAKIKLTDMVNNQVYAESETFRIKPYLLTRIDENGDYYEYRKNRDQWGFSNTQADMWPQTWYNQFNYQGIDPFTGSQYSQYQGDFTFAYSIGAEHPDWVSWVNTFGVDACYFSTTLGIYSQTALLKWNSEKDFWGGSCFGIAVANALAFSHKEQFQNKYPNYPSFINPITVVSDTGVKRVVNELYTHQFGNPHLNIRTTIGVNKTPKETLIELIQMFEQDTAQIRTLSIINNNGEGGHAILAYGLEKDKSNQSLFHILVYDNAYPDSTNRITIDTSANANNGSWTNPLWPGWGGNIWIYLRNPTVEYLVNPTLQARNFNQSPFIFEQAELQIINKAEGSTRIIDNNGNVTGFYNNNLHIDIPGSVPLIIDNPVESPPYGYSLPTDNYSIVLGEFTEDTVETFFFTGNKSFMYERNGADQTQTDRLFFDGGVSAVNPDAQTKTIKLLNLINETTQEKLSVLRSLELSQNDSVKIENPDSNKVKLISYGTAKNYDIELNYVTENGLGRFGDFNIPISANTSHTFVPDWENVSGTQLTVLVDLGNDGTIDDTLYLNNTVNVEDQGSLLSPDNYNLAQNYPNPFNPVTTIQYSIPQRSSVTLKVYDVLGNEIAALVNEEKDRGVYSVTFDASQLASGIYFYRLQAGSFARTKKMIYLR